MKVALKVQCRLSLSPSTQYRRLALLLALSGPLLELLDATLELHVFCAQALQLDLLKSILAVLLSNDGF